MKRIILTALLIMAPIATASAHFVCDAWHAAFTGCDVIENPVAIDFSVLKNVTNQWYTPFTTHPLWKDNYCGTTSYIKLETDTEPGLEHQYYLKNEQLDGKHEMSYSEWHKIINHFVTDKTIPGVSFWDAEIKIDLIDIWMPAPRTKSYVIIVDPSASPKWWAAYYCSSTDGGLFTKGFDIRSAYLPLEPEVVAQIIVAAKAAGVPQSELDKLYETPYSGCKVNNFNGESYVHP